MSLKSGPFPSSSVSDVIFGIALNDYTRQTGIDLLNNPLAVQVKNCATPSALLDVLREQALAIDGVEDDNTQLIECLGPIKAIIEYLHVFFSHNTPSGSASPVSTAISLPNNDILMHIPGFQTGKTRLFWDRLPSHSMYLLPHF